MLITSTKFASNVWTGAWKNKVAAPSYEKSFIQIDVPFRAAEFEYGVIAREYEDIVQGAR